jgi:hypothetical protein
VSEDQERVIFVLDDDIVVVMPGFWGLGCSIKLNWRNVNDNLQIEFWC